ncbi:hypothetical protein [Dialister sp.]|uniref:hypothetical protein n=1 Tax=Dialister sp. TaxID=1955814 RepID=UPI002E807C95|nr:hypothetical protein [Dialister sp.]MEE3453889.1 hypothetical protein [Dialister sp.]
MTWDDYKNRMKASDPVAGEVIKEAEELARVACPSLEEFDAVMAESQHYAAEAGMTEHDISDAIRAVRSRQ